MGGKHGRFLSPDHPRDWPPTGKLRCAASADLQDIRDIAPAHQDVEIVCLAHLNSNVEAPVNEILGNEKRVYVFGPIDYLALIWPMNKSHLDLTDSGGIQEEAPSLGKLVLVMGDATDRMEGIQAGTAGFTLLAASPSDSSAPYSIRTHFLPALSLPRLYTPTPWQAPTPRSSWPWLAVTASSPPTTRSTERSRRTCAPNSPASRRWSDACPLGRGRVLETADRARALALADRREIQF